jgi:hypothetical protein
MSLILFVCCLGTGAPALTQSKEDTAKGSASSQATKGHSSRTTKGAPRAAKASLKATNAPSSQPTKQPTKKKKQAASQIRERSDSDDDGHSSIHPRPRPPSHMASSYKTNKGPQKRQASNIDEWSSSISHSSQPTLASRYLENNKVESTSSMSYEDKGAGYGSDDRYL